MNSFPLINAATGSSYPAPPQSVKPATTGPADLPFVLFPVGALPIGSNSASSDEKEKANKKVDSNTTQAAASKFPILVKQPPNALHSARVSLHRKPRPPQDQAHSPAYTGRYTLHLSSPKPSYSPTNIDVIKKKIFWAFKNVQNPLHELARIKIELIKKPTDFTNLKKCAFLYNQLGNASRVRHYLGTALRINPKDEELLQLQKTYSS